MIRQGHLGVYELTALLALATGSRIFLSITEVMAKIGLSAGWMIPLFSMIFFLPSFYVYYRLLQIYPGESVVVIIERVWGRWLAAPILLVVWLNVMMIGALTVRQFTETFITITLPQTPISVLLAVELSLAAYASYMGLEVIGRTAFLMAPWIIIAILVILAGLIPYSNPRYLLPLWGAGLPKLLLNGALRSSLFLEILAIGVFAPALRRHKDLLAIGTITTFITGLLYALVTALIMMSTSLSRTERIPYPLYFMARQIYFGRFLQRMEALFIIIWFIVSASALFLTFHTAVTIVAQGLSLPFYQPLCIPTAIIMFALALMPSSFVAARNWDAGYQRQYGGLIIIGMVITYLVALLRKRWGERHAQDTQ